jgi:RNA polymerase sigma factor (sigma-70 family)
MKATEKNITVALGRLAVDSRDEYAWRALHKSLWPFVMSIVYRRLKDKIAAEDAAQEVFLRLVHSRPYERIRDGGEFQAYVWRVAINCANTSHVMAQQHSDRKSALSDYRGSEDGAGTAAASEDRLIFEEVLTLAEGSLAPQDSRLLTILLQGRSLREAADELGQTYSGAGVRLHRLRLKLSKLLKVQGSKI